MPGSGGIISKVIQPSWLRPDKSLAGEKSRSTRPNTKIASASTIIAGVASRAETGRSKTCGVLRPQALAVRLRQLAHARASLPNSRPRNQPVPMSMHEHRDDDHEQDGADVGIIEFADRDHEFLADAAGADEAHHRGLADIDLEAQQRVAGVAGGDLRQHGKAHAGQPARARRAHAFDRLHVGILDDLGEQFAERAGRMDRDREHARHRPEPEGDDEDQCEHDAGHGAGEFQQPPDREAQPRARRGILRGEEIKRERDDTHRSSVPT